MGRQPAKHQAGYDVQHCGRLVDPQHTNIFKPDDGFLRKTKSGQQQKIQLKYQTKITNNDF